MTVQAELDAFFDPRYLAHRAHERARVEAAAALLAGAAPAAVEIGMNTGAFLVGLARRYAPAPVVGIEWNGKHLPRAADRMRRASVDNAILVHADARLAVPLLVEVGTLSEVHVHFPDPWWKARHSERRLFDAVFLRMVARRLAADGRFYVKSDVFELLYRLRAAALACEALEPLPAESWPDEREWTLTTRERKCMHTAIPFGRGYWRRRDDFDTALPDAPELAATWPVEDEVDVLALIRGAPLYDRARFRPG
jgi:tRNA (guanine-N7-)-methyltransferase